MSDVTYRISGYHDQILQELLCANKYEPAEKDILIVVHNQIEYLKKCVDSVRKNTKKYQIYIWDNASDKETKEWISSQNDIICVRSEINEGFIKPNNALAKMSTNPYIILLNSDTEVLPDWDKAMIAHIQQHNFSQVGYLGGILNSKGKGVKFSFGSEIDYIPGWCFCIPRKIYDEFGLFDEKYLYFAYCEDSDFSMRLLDAKKNIFSLHLGLVIHHENKTIKEVAKTHDCRKSYDHNHEIIEKRYFYKLNQRL